MSIRIMAAIGLATLMLPGLARAALTAHWVHNPISPAAIASDPALANQQSWSLIATNTDGHWASAGLRAVLPSGTFYQFVALVVPGDFRPTPALINLAPHVEFDTYVSSPRNQGGFNPPSLLGAFPEAQPPMSFGGSGDQIPGIFAVSWGDPQATSGPGPGTYEIVRLTFPQGVIPTVFWHTNPPSLPNSSNTSQVEPDQTIFIPQIPEPASLGLLGAAGLLAIRRRNASVQRAQPKNAGRSRLERPFFVTAPVWLRGGGGEVSRIRYWSLHPLDGLRRTRALRFPSQTGLGCGFLCWHWEDLALGRYGNHSISECAWKELGYGLLGD